MLHRLRRHPIPIEADLESCLVLTYACEAAPLRPLLPPGLALDEVRGRAFLAVAMVQTRNLRPAGFPACTGRDFFLSGYRLFCKRRGRDGRTRRGLYIPRSDADRRLMVWGGNLLTHYRYRLARARLSSHDGRLTVRVASADGAGDVDVTAELSAPAALPEGSPFADWREARRFAGPLPLTFDHEPQSRLLVIVRGERDGWRPRPVSAAVRRCSFLERPPIDAAGATLASAFYLEGVDYRWGRGRVERLEEVEP